MQDAAALRQIKARYRSLAALMDERLRRQWAATEAQAYGRGGLSAVSSATGMSRNTIRKGLVELAARKKHLAHEKRLTAEKDKVNADRRRLPMVKIKKEYVFDGPEGKRSLHDLFEN